MRFLAFVMNGKTGLVIRDGESCVGLPADDHHCPGLLEDLLRSVRRALTDAADVPRKGGRLAASQLSFRATPSLTNSR